MTIFIPEYEICNGNANLFQVCLPMRLSKLWISSLNKSLILKAQEFSYSPDASKIPCARPIEFPFTAGTKSGSPFSISSI